MRTIIIGDIHGCSGAFRALLDFLAAHARTDRLILLGDLFDRGPDSRTVFEMVKNLSGQYGERFVLLRGNHEDYLLRQQLSARERLIWERVGRAATVKSFKEYGEKMESAIPWLTEHTRLFWKGDGFQCVHAGILVDPPEANDSWTLLHDHDMVPQNRYSGTLTVTGHIALEKPVWFAGDRETWAELPEDTEMPLPERGVICIDTGCGKGGRLTGMVTEDGQFTLKSVPEG